MPNRSTNRQDQQADEQIVTTPPKKWWDRYDAILDSQLSGKHKLAMLAIAGYAGDANECFAATKTIARRLSVTSAAAGRTIKELLEAGFLDRVPRKHSPSILRVCWLRFGMLPQPAETSIDVSVDRRLRSPQPAKAQVDTTYKNTKMNTQSNTPAGTRFVPPSVEDVHAYCRERGNKIDPERFVDHYTANGWKVGGRTPMKDWQAAVRNWERNERPPSTNRAGQPGTLFDADTFATGGNHDPA